MGTLIRRLQHYPFLGPTLVMVAGSGIGQLIVLAAYPLLTRLYAPSDFGVLAIYASFLSLLLASGSLRWELAIPLPKNDKAAIHLLVISFVTIGITTLALAVLALLLNHLDVTAQIYPSFARYAWLLPVGLVAGGAYQILNYWAIRRGNFSDIGTSKFNQGLGQTCSQVLLGLVGAGPMGLLVGDAIGRFSGTGRLSRQLLTKADRHLFRQISLARLLAQGRRYRRFPLFAGPASLVHSTGNHIAPLLIAAVYGGASAGLFLVAYRIVAAPASLLARAVSQVFFSRTASALHNDKSSVRVIVRRISGRMFIISLVPAALCFAIAPMAFSAVFGDLWLEAGVMARWMSLLLVAKLSVGPIVQTLNLLQRQELQFLWDIVRLISVLAAIVVPAFLGLPVIVAVAAYSLLSVVMYALLAVMGISAARSA